MATIVEYCQNCGQAFDPSFGAACPHCAAQPQAVIGEPATWPAPVQEGAATASPEAVPWGLGMGLLSWIISVALIVGTQIIAAIVYVAIQVFRTGGMPKEVKIDWLLAMLSIASAFPAHLLTLAFCWLIVTGRGQRPFWRMLGWNWHPQFKWVHAVALAFLMLGAAMLFSKILPHHETDLERILKLGASVRVLTALLAVLTAPLVEEVVYRGVLYPGIAKRWGWVAGLIVTTVLFALVHVPQYWGSWAAIATILLLSFVLTLLRATTGSILPSVATHLVYNGIQSVLLLFGLDDSLKKQTTETAWALWTQLLGGG
jgi:uncharacterized protein